MIRNFWMSKKSDFVDLVKEHEGLIVKITSLYTNTAADAEDLQQEIIYQLWKSFDSFSGRSKISTWMYRVSLNTALLHIKRNKRIQYREMDRAELQHIDFSDHTLEERVQKLYSTIKDLNNIERSIILLYLENKSYDEIAEITGFTKTNIATRINRIKSKLKSKIKK